MKRAEVVALWVAIGLLIVTGILGIAVYQYGTICFWAAALAAAAQTVLGFLSWWGLKLTRQQRALVAEVTTKSKFTPLAPLGSFHMSYSDDAAPAPTPVQEVEPEDITSLDTGFQRVIIGLCAVMFFVIAGVIGYMVWTQFAAVMPGTPIVISPHPIDPGAVVAAIFALLTYLLLASFSRVDRRTEGFGEAANGIVILGIPGAGALLIAVIAAWADTYYATQSAAIFIAAVLALQGLELLINSLRSMGSIDELEQTGIDLQQMPLVPLISSGWIVGLRVLMSESVGMTQQDSSWIRVLGRLLPRVFVAGVVFLIALSTFRIVPTGDVGIREHLGVTTAYDLAHPLPAGLHIMWPWPIDKLSLIPTEKIHSAVVGTEVEHKSKLGESVFSFWSSHKSKPGSEFVTGDVASGGTSYMKVQIQTKNAGVPGQKVKISTASQLLDGFVVAWWRVKNPGLFFHNVENRNIIEYGGSAGIGNTPHSKPMDNVLVHQMLLAAITRVFARHSLHEILESETPKVVSEIKAFMQKRLDAMQSGIQITNVDIKDLHPPKGVGGYRSPRTGRLIPGPARAFEEVVSAREEKHSLIQEAKMRAFQDVTIANGEAKALVSDAEAVAAKRVDAEKGRAAALVAESTAFAKAGTPARIWAFYRAIGKVFPDISKVILGPGVPPPQIWQLGHAHSHITLAPPTTAGDVNSGLNPPNVAGAMGSPPQQQ